MSIVAEQYTNEDVESLLNALIEKAISGHTRNTDEALLKFYGCFCKAAEAIQDGRVQQAERDGVWQTLADGVVISRMTITTGGCPVSEH